MFQKQRKLPDRLQRVLGKAPAKTETASGDTRIFDRERSFSQCKMVGPTGELFEGIVVDHSKSGLRIRFQNHSRLPRYVRVRAPLLGVNRDAEVVWQDKSDAGLTYY